jgi:hypothetical protein
MSGKVDRKNTEKTTKPFSFLKKNNIEWWYKKKKTKKDINPWARSSDLKHHYTWHNHKAQSLGNEMLKYEIKTITNKKSKIKISN